MSDVVRTTRAAGIPREELLTTKEELVSKHFTSGVLAHGLATEGQCSHAADVVYAAILGNKHLHITPPSRQIIPLTGGFHVDTTVSTPNGPQKIGELQVSSPLHSDYGRTEEVQEISETQMGALYELKYVPLGGLYTETSSFKCTGDQALHMTTSRTGLYIVQSLSKNSIGQMRIVRWHTWCHHSDSKGEERDMEIDTLDELADIAPREHLHYNFQGIIEDDSDSDGDLDYQESGSEDNNLSDSEDEEDHAPDQRFLTKTEIHEFLQESKVQTAVRRFDVKQKTRCRCGLFRSIELSMPDVASAAKFYKILKSEHFARIDPLMVRKGDNFATTAKQLSDNNHKRAVNDLARIFQRNVSTFVPGGLVKLPVSPYLIGFWMGDGDRKHFLLYSSDDEILVEMQKAVNIANKTRPLGKEPVKLVTTIGINIGDEIVVRGETTFANKICWRHQISATAHNFSDEYYQPYVDFLQENNLRGSKWAGIPESIFLASVFDRLEFLAGMIESDGWYSLKGDTYWYAQYIEEHFKMVHDAARLARDLGIKVLGPHTNRGGKCVHIAMTGPNIERLQPHLRLERKRRDHTVKHTDPNLRSIASVTLLKEPGPYRSFKTISGQVTLEDGIVAYDCHKNTPGELASMTDIEHESAIREYHDLVADRVLDLMASLGVRSFDELAGRYDLLSRF